MRSAPPAPAVAGGDGGAPLPLPTTPTLVVARQTGLLFLVWPSPLRPGHIFAYERRDGSTLSRSVGHGSAEEVRQWFRPLTAEEARRAAARHGVLARVTGRLH